MNNTLTERPERTQVPSIWSDSGSPQASNDFRHVWLSVDRSWQIKIYYTALSLSALLIFALDWVALSVTSLTSFMIGVALSTTLAATGWFSAPRSNALPENEVSWAIRAGAFIAVIAVVAIARG